MSDVGDVGDVEGGTRGSDEAGSSFTASGGDASAAPFTVSDSAKDPVLCPGQCAELSAEAAGGKPPYIFTWDQGLTAEGGALTVCPNGTTTYTVTATDSSVASFPTSRPRARSRARR